MKLTIIAIILILLLIIPTIPLMSIEQNSLIIPFNQRYQRLDVPSPSWLKGADQIHINLSGIGLIQQNRFKYAQSFKPTKNTLTAVALHFFRMGIPHEQTKMTISIKDELDGPELTTITILAKDWKIKTSGTWVLFDFPDITVIPEHTHYTHMNSTRLKARAAEASGALSSPDSGPRKAAYDGGVMTPAGAAPARCPVAGG